MAAQHPDFVHIRGDDLAGGNIETVLHEINLLEADAKQAPDPQNEQGYDRWHQHRDVDEPDFCHLLAPSIVAASYKLGLTADNAAI